jgi:alpha-tubulin suppressor-like RCC1 family protein
MRRLGVSSLDVNRCSRRVATAVVALLAGSLIGSLPVASATEAPVNTAPPTVSGTREVGHTLTASSGTWTGTPTFTYQWERCGRGACVAISGATGETYAFASADVGQTVEVSVTASNGSGSATMASGASAASWGQNDHGQLGTIYKDPSEELPVGVEGLNDIRAVAAAESFNLAILGDGTVAAWGGDSNGQLGDDGHKANWEREKSHVIVHSLSGVTAVAAGGEHALALLSDGTVKAWGSNQSGELGEGVGGFETKTGIDSRVPHTVPLSEKAIAIAANGHSDYALLEGGEVEAWGGNGVGELGVSWPTECKSLGHSGCSSYECLTGGGKELCGTTPHLVVYGSGSPVKEVVAIYAGGDDGYAVLASGKVLSWGSNKFGALGQPTVSTGSTAKFEPPGEVMRWDATKSERVALTGVRELAAGSKHALALREGGTVFGWGANEEGPLGATSASTCGKTPCDPEALQLTGLEAAGVEAISAGSKYSMGISSGKIYGLGRDLYGELGDGDETDASKTSPGLVKSLGLATAVSAGVNHAVALLQAGVEPPAPHVVVHPESGAVRLEWWPGEAERVVEHEFERPGAEEEEEGGDSGSTEGPPVNVVRPKITHEPTNATPITYVGQTLKSSEGSWTGEQPITTEYQWQRCNALVECTSIGSATSSSYKLTEADVGSFIRIAVKAQNAAKPTGVTAYSEVTSVVKSASEAEEGGKNLQSVNLASFKEHYYVVNEMYKGPLNHVPYEFKLTTFPTATEEANGILKTRSRAVVVTPGL